MVSPRMTMGKPQKRQKKSKERSFFTIDKEGGPHPIDGPSPAYWGQLTRIFGGRTPSTSIGRSSRSTGSISSIKSGRGLEERIYSALAELVSNDLLKFDDVGLAYKFIAKSSTHSEVFLLGSMVERAKVVGRGLKKKEA